MVPCACGCGLPTTQPFLVTPPVRLCCGQAHWGPVCPDGRVMCCVCFGRFSQDELAVDPEDGKRWDVCRGCEAANEAYRREHPR
jgi:hypothetical protein